MGFYDFIEFTHLCAHNCKCAHAYRSRVWDRMRVGGGGTSDVDVFVLERIMS